MNEGYISRILETLAIEALIERESLGPVTRVDWPAMLRLRAQELGVYTMTPRELADHLRLLPADVGADTVLVRPDNEVVFARSTEDQDGLTWAAPSQVAIDCLTGSGRMPAEGEAVIEWMNENESRWRSPSIKALFESSDGTSV